jgi:hypothetical protein
MGPKQHAICRLGQVCHYLSLFIFLLTYIYIIGLYIFINESCNDYNMPRGKDGAQTTRCVSFGPGMSFYFTCIILVYTICIYFYINLL